jgi:UDP-N-acetyl-L-fucosamine synthase
VSKLKVMTIVGTRPELIRLSRLIPKLDEHTNHILVHTGQNDDPKLNQIFFDELEIRKPDYFLKVDTSSMGTVMADTIRKSEEVLLKEKPDAVMILGDTNSAVAAIVAERMQIPVYHMEAGNRSFDANVPEELNRKLVDHIASFNLPYTEHALRNLLAEGLHPRRICVTGSPIREIYNHYRDKIEKSSAMQDLSLTQGKYFLVSVHRQENVDSPERLKLVLECLTAVRDTWNLPVLVSTHPRTKKRLEEIGSKEIQGIDFHEPFGYFDYNQLQKNAMCVISDSGTISEEAAIIGFPAISFRDSMERPEALDAGVLILSGLSAPNLLQSIEILTSREPIHLTPADYKSADFSERVFRFLFSTVRQHRAWLGLQK